MASISKYCKDEDIKQILKKKDENQYAEERSGNQRFGASAIVKANVGLMYSSDYGYAAKEVDYSSICPYSYNDLEIRNNNWLYFGKIEWLKGE